MIPVWLRAFGRHCFVAFTEADNRTTSIYRIAGLVVSVHMAVLQAVDTIVNSHPLDASGFGTGVAAIWAAVGLGERLTYHKHDRDETEEYER